MNEDYKKVYFSGEEGNRKVTFVKNNDVVFTTSISDEEFDATQDMLKDLEDNCTGERTVPEEDDDINEDQE